MKYNDLRKNIQDYYLKESKPNADNFKERIFSLLDKYDKENPGRNAYELKAAQYNCIADNFIPVIFDNIPFYFETGVLCAFSDGFFGRGAEHANGWVNMRNGHIFKDADPYKNELFCKNIREKLYLTCGPYVDLEHFPIPFKKIFSIGIKGIYEEAQIAADKCKTDEEKDFVNCATAGLLAIKKMADKFSKAALKMLESETDEDKRENLKLIANTASKVPWNKPESTYEGLCAMAFMRKALGSIEGVGFNSFGRPDVLLWESYKNDKEKGVSDEEIYDYICKFMLIWDCHLNKNMLMQGYADYEYENTLTLGGCDEDGKEVFNKLTEMFIDAQVDLDGIYPKIMCRYSAESSEEYLSLINKPTLHGKSILLYENDDSEIPALIKSGVEEKIARNYAVSGCWDIQLTDYTKKCVGEYVNLLKVMEWTVHMPKDKLKENGLDFISIESCKSFDEVYRIVLENILRLIHHKASINAEGGRLWSKAVPTCAVSALMIDPLKTLKDFTAGGTRFNWETFCMAGFPDVIDSLLAIKYLCFEEKTCTLPEFVTECKNNWQNEVLRQRAIHSPGYGDGTEEAALLSKKLNDDIYNGTRDLPVAFDGKYDMGYYMYTEIIWWGKETLATPNGRHDGDYMSHGLTPSRLHEIKSVTDVFIGLKDFDFEKCPANSIINVLLPATNVAEVIMNSFLRACAAAKTQALQINCVNKDDLIKAQKDPENYKHIIVRVCGFSAPFVSLSPEFQNEFLTRNYYEM